MLFVGTSIIHPSTEGVFLLCNILDLLIYSISKYLCGVLHDSTISNFHFLKKNFRQVEQALLNIDSKLLQIEKNSAGSFYPEEMLEKISECKRQFEKLEFDFQKLEEEISKWQSQN